MWAPIAILVGLVVIVGFFGLVGVFNPHYSPEIFIEEKIHHMLDHMFEPMHIQLHPTHPEVSTKWTAVGLSAAMLILGGSLGWALYLARKVDSWKLVSGSPLLKGIHTFLWNRWYMNPTYYAVFVDGTLKLKQALFDGFELGVMDKINDGVSGGVLSLKQFIYENFELKVIDKISDAVSRVFMLFSHDLYQFFEMGGIDRYFNYGVPSIATRLYHRIKKIQTGTLSYNIYYLFLIWVLLLVGLLLWGR